MITRENINYDAVCIATAQQEVFAEYRCAQFYSQAEHNVILSLYVEKLARERGLPEDIVRIAAKHALLHYTSNLCLEYFRVEPSPITWDLIAEIEQRLIVDARRAVRVQIAARQCEPLGATIACLPWRNAAAAFTQRFCELWPDWADDAKAEAWRESVRALTDDITTN